MVDLGQTWYLRLCFDHAFDHTLITATDHGQILTMVKSMIFGSDSIFQKFGQPWFNHGQNPCLNNG